MCPRNWTAVAELRESLFDYCELLRDGMVDVCDAKIRNIEKDWSRKLCVVLETLRQEKTTKNPLVLDTLSKLAFRVGSLKYTLGSNVLKNQVDEWKGQHSVKTTSKEKMINLKEYSDIKQRQNPTVKSSGLSENSDLTAAQKKPS